MQSDLPILIAAAGIGSRLGMNLPKCLVEVQGRSLLDRLLTDVLGGERDIRVVVGFRDNEVIAHARRLRNDLLFVRNPSFRDTSVRHSFWLAARHVGGACIIVDGDTLMEPGSWRAFRAAAQRHETLIGVTPSSTTDAVFADIEGPGGRVLRFTRRERLGYEWCGVAKMPSAALERPVEYVYQCLEPLLPAASFELEVAEVDTPQDLRLAAAFAQRLDASRARLGCAVPAQAPRALQAVYGPGVTP